tara:strand:- start:2454 stop:2672 length:219 start_codon:yes stop_codon:yes gene_type:complete
MNATLRKEIEANIAEIKEEIKDVYYEIDELGNRNFSSYIMISQNLKELSQRRRFLREKLEKEMKRLEGGSDD